MLASRLRFAPMRCGSLMPQAPEFRSLTIIENILSSLNDCLFFDFSEFIVAGGPGGLPGSSPCHLYFHFWCFLKTKFDKQNHMFQANKPRTKSFDFWSLEFPLSSLEFLGCPQMIPGKSENDFREFRKDSNICLFLNYLKYIYIYIKWFVYYWKYNLGNFSQGQHRWQFWRLRTWASGPYWPTWTMWLCLKQSKERIPRVMTCLC